METNVKEQKQKKGFMAAIWESMTKTGGCCGSGESCGCSPQSNSDKEKAKEKNDGLKAKSGA
jgi:hypothetical protein